LQGKPRPPTHTPDGGACGAGCRRRWCERSQLCSLCVLQDLQQASARHALLAYIKLCGEPLARASRVEPGPRAEMHSAKLRALDAYPTIHGVRLVLNSLHDAGGSMCHFVLLVWRAVCAAYRTNTTLDL